MDFQSKSFVVKDIKCLSNFINKECSGKPWNRSQHFSDFIKPKENLSISLKDHRFNRLNGCALTILFHIDDIKSYLETFTTVTNGVAILDRGSLEVEILKPIFAAISVIGFHITRPFHCLLMDKDTCYSTLLLSGFISQDHFIISLWITTLVIRHYCYRVSYHKTISLSPYG